MTDIFLRGAAYFAYAQYGVGSGYFATPKAAVWRNTPARLRYVLPAFGRSEHTRNVFFEHYVPRYNPFPQQ